MQPGARLQAAIDVLAEILGKGRAASVALADWGRAHRFAGSGDRAWIGNLVFDALRRKQSLAYLMQSEEPRAIAIAALYYSWGVRSEEVASLCTGEGCSPAPLTGAEVKGFASDGLAHAPPWVQGDYPEWLHPSFTAAFGQDAVEQGRALAQRAPIDLRVNTLKAARDKVLKAFAKNGAIATVYSPLGVRLPARDQGARSPNVEAEPSHGRGWFEVQDEGSQIAGLLAGAGPRMQVADICAGAGGKTLAMAAQMQNTGQIYAYDSDAVRFRPIFERLKRAGARNVQTLPPGDEAALGALEGRMDLVLIDAPCSGTGVWRRRPDAKWRLTASHLAGRLAVQAALLTKGAALVKPGGTLAYVTCSLLPEENERQIEALLSRAGGFVPVIAQERATKILSQSPSATAGAIGVRLSPARHGTDGFYIALLARSEG